MRDIVIIGAGIAGLVVAKELYQKYPDLDILLIDGGDQLPTCSQNSTALVALRGIRPGVSPLGDELHQAFYLAKEYFSTSLSATRLVHYAINTKNDNREKYLKRFGDTSSEFLIDGIDSRSFLDISKEEAFYIHFEEFKKEVLSFLPAKSYVRDMVKNYQGEQILLLSGKKIASRVIINCTNTAQSFFNSQERIKKVQGSFLSWKGSFFEKSFSVSIDGINLIYDQKSQKTILGSSSQEVPHYIPDKAFLRDAYDKITEVTTQLPPFDEGAIHTGIRAKAPKRRALLSQNKNEYIINGLYKNGYSLSFLMSAKLIRKLESSGHI